MSVARALRLTLLAGIAVGLPAQVAFTYRTSAGPATSTVSNNGSIVFAPTPVGSSSTVTLIVTNGFTDPITLADASITGGGPFRVTFSPVQLAGSGSTSLVLTFTPPERATASGGLELQFTRAAGAVRYSFFLSGAGQAADLVASYLLLPDGNQIPVANGGTIAFPQTAVRAASTATFVIVNRGNGPGTLSAVSLSGDEFRLSGLPLMPATIQPERDVRFNVTYAPVTSGAAAGALRLNAGGQQWTVALAGQSVSPALVYEFVTASGVTPVAPGSAIRMPETPLGETASGVVRVRNTGTLEARIGAAAVVGAAFRLTDVPPLPVTIAPGGAISLSLHFTPRDAGDASGTLIVDNFSIPVSGSGVGSRLSLAARIGSTVTPIAAEGGSVTFPNTALGSSSTVYIRIGNAGNAPGAVNGISLSVPAFTMPQLPALPAAIAPGQTLEFAVVFTPTTRGAVGGVLQIDDRAVAVRGIGDGPPGLPAVTIVVPDRVNALDQPPLSVRLAEPYGVDLTGRVTLSFLSDNFGDDPNIQFSTGGRAVEFRIPANTTEAIFGETVKALPFQAGTVAGVITIAASFAAGSANVTPATAPSRTVTVPPGPPQIRNVQVGARSANSFEVLVSGFAPTRSVAQMNLEFTPAPGAKLQTASLPFSVEGPFTAWYGSAAGRSFGSQFTAALVVNVNGDAGAVQSVTVTAVNAQGASTPVSVNLR